jgi:CRISPR-associated protein Csb2
MLALAFTFPAGRYHATPWDRHVNEGAVAWPPEPWRILRALIATWHHKLKHAGRHSEDTLRSLIESLSTQPPEYTLPPACHSHTRHYMPQFATGKTSLIFDAFTAVDRETPLGIAWPEVDLPGDQRALLDDLLAVMGYLGRAESWVEAKVVDTAPPPNCYPGDTALDTQTGEIKGELVTLHAPLPASDYQALRSRFLTDKKAQKKLGPTLPESLLDALSVETADLRKLGWSQPPAACKVSYLRPVDALRPKLVSRRIQAPAIMAVNFILDGKPLPRLEDSLRIGELMRIATMGQCKLALGEDNVPPIFSGHNLPASKNYRHAFYLPWDSNGDGKLDRILVYVPDGMNDAEQRALVRVRRLWDRSGSEWQLALESSGLPSVAPALVQASAAWESITPYLHPWHVKKNFCIEDQIRRECRKRGIPEPIAIESFDEVDVGKGRKRRPIHFQRFRRRRGLSQPDRLGSFCRLTFPEPIPGPLALGFACHYGLGLFKPVDS